MAQEDTRRGGTVSDRQRPDYDPKGVKLGGFTFLPSLQISELYDDNILSADTGTRDDFITRVTPAAILKSNWSKHSLKFSAGGEISRFASNSTEDSETFFVGGSGRVDITGDMFVGGGVEYASVDESRESPDDPSGVEPSEFETISPMLQFFNRWNRVSVNARGGAAILNFKDTTAVGGAIIDNDDRDRSRYAASIRLGYQFVTEYEGFIKSSYNKISYDDAVDSSGFNRDSDGYEITVGTRIEIGSKLFGDVFGGYRRQDYEDPTLSPIDGATWGGALTWNVTGLTTLMASVTRDVIETTQVGASGYFSTAYKGTVDHELLRNLILGGYGSFTINDYEGNGRDDEDIGAGAYIRYLIHRNLYLSASYGYHKRESNVVGGDYEKNVFMLRLSTQF